MAARVVDCFALFYSFSTEGLIVHHQSPARAIHFHFQRNPQLPTVAEHGAVGGWKPRRTGVEVAVRLPRGCLLRSIGEFNRGAIAHGPIAAARTCSRLEHRT